MSFLLFQSNADSSSSMTELSFLNLLRLLIISSNINFIIFTVKIKDFIKFLNLPINTLLLLMSFIMVSLLLFIPLAETSNGILIFMLLFLLVDSINFFTLLTFDIFTLNRSLDNGNSFFLILFQMVNILTNIFV